MIRDARAPESTDRDRGHLGVQHGPCIFPGCVSTDRHFHGPFPGGYDNPADPDGPPIPFTTEPEPGVRDYNGALLPDSPDSIERRVLRQIEGYGCEAAEFYDLDKPGWDSCLNPDNREDPLTYNTMEDRCFPCLAHSALVALREETRA